MIENKKAINIKDLTLTEVKNSQKLMFDPKSYLGPDSCDAVERLVHNNITIKSWLINVFHVKVGAPDEYEAIRAKEDIVGSVIEDVGKSINGNKWRESQRLLANALLVYPERREELVRGNKYSDILLRWTNSARPKKYGQYFSGLFDLSIIDSQLANGVVDEEGKEMVKRLVHTKSFAGESFNPFRAANARIVFPDDPDIWIPKDRDWSKIRDYFEKNRQKQTLKSGRQNELRNFFENLYAATILGAVDVKLSKKHGLQVSNSRKQLSNETVPIPERRRF
jgi:hypothetical protein